MRLFLDTSVLIAACGSATGASREIFHLASTHGWTLLATPYVIEEVLRNLPKLASSASAEWARLRPEVSIVDDVFTLDRPVVFDIGKDRPILFSALAWADILLTLDKVHFGSLMDRPFFGMAILRPGMFLMRERAAGRLT